MISGRGEPGLVQHAPSDGHLSNPSAYTRYCDKLATRTQLCAETQLQAGDAETFKAYLMWRKGRSRVRKESSIRAYWKRLSMCYKNLTGHNMSKELLEDVCNVKYTRQKMHPPIINDMLTML